MGRAWCSRCATEVVVVTPERAATLTLVTVRTINRMVENGTLHFIETQEGWLLLCLTSLSQN